jgi:gentisate 1,2-dioxygenase
MATQTVTQTDANGWDAGDELVQSALKVHTKPLWTQMAKLNPPLPNPTCVPHIWRYDEVRPSLLRAGELISEQQAERRVLMLVNPARGRRIWPRRVCSHVDILVQTPLILQTHYMLDFS